MGERRSVQTGKMPSQLHGHGPSAAAANTRPPAASSTITDAEDQYYMTRMREILSGFPNTGPPSYPVQILDHVYMGNQRNADNVELLRRYGISHVLNCAGGRQRSGTYPKESGIKEVLLIAADDSEDFDIAGRFEEAIEFLDRVRRAKGKALVHCNLGVNRSGALVAAYLLAEQRRTLLEVVNYLKVKRFVVLSNKGFRRQLIQFARSRGKLDPIIRSADTTDSSNDGHYEIPNRSRSEEGRRKGGGGGSKGDNRAVGCTIEKVVNRDRNRREKLEETKVAKSEEGIQDSRGGHGAVRLPKTGDPSPPAPPTEEPCLRERLWTLPRYTGRGERDRPKPASPPPPPTVEVFVSHHGGGEGSGGGGEGGGGSSGVRLSSASSVADDRKTSSVTETAADSRSSTKNASRQLEPVYETKSYDDATASAGSRNASRIAATGSGTTTTTTTATGSGGGRMSAAAESVSAKLTGLLGSLLGGAGGPKRQPLRSTSYSNVSAGGSSPSSRSLASLPPPLAPEERTTSVSSGSLQTSASGSSLSTTRPLRIYTRSSTDTEIYRTRQDTARQAAGRSGLGLLLRRPDPKS